MNTRSASRDRQGVGIRNFARGSEVTGSFDQEEVESYERLKRGEFDELENLRGPGHMLISVRIAQKISQRE